MGQVIKYYVDEIDYYGEIFITKYHHLYFDDEENVNSIIKESKQSRHSKVGDKIVTMIDGEKRIGEIVGYEEREYVQQTIVTTNTKLFVDGVLASTYGYNNEFDSKYVTFAIDFISNVCYFLERVRRFMGIEKSFWKSWIYKPLSVFSSRTLGDLFVRPFSKVF